MKIFLKFAAIAATAMAAIAILAVPKAYADPITGTFTFSVFTGSGITDMANAASTPSGPSGATFTYTGPLSFNNTSQNGGDTFGQFFNSFNGTIDTTNYSSNISNFTSPNSQFASLSAFLAASTSTPGFTDNSFFEITGAYSGDGTVMVGHDDGASFYTDGETVFTSPSPTPYIISSGPLPEGSNAPFLLDYVESNGAPARLDVSIVPEPSSIALLGTGVLGIFGLMRRRLGING